MLSKPRFMFPQNKTVVLILCLLFTLPFFTIAQTTFTESAASFGLDLGQNKDGGHAWADFDNDGDLDVLVLENNNNSSVKSYLMRQGPIGTFTNVQATLAPGMLGDRAERQAAWGDINNDGRPDFLINSSGNGGGTRVAIQIFIQNTNGTFGDGIGGTVPLTVGRNSNATFRVNPINAEGVGFFDFEGDGDLDIFFDNHNYGIELLRNNYIDHTTHTVTNPAPNAMFTHLTDQNGSPNVQFGLNQFATDGDYGSAADVNDDGWVDIFMRKQDENDFFLNQGGFFSNGADLGQAENNNKGATGLWDLDNDGDLDAVWTENGLTQIYRNDGAGVWTAMGGGVFPGLPQPTDLDNGSSSNPIDALAAGDIDNDGDIDILLVGDAPGNGSNNRSYLYINQLNSPTPAPGVIGSGAAMSFSLDAETFNGSDGEGTTMVDVDDDGDLDIYMSINGTNQLYINNLPAANRNNHLLIDVTEDRAADGSTGGFPGRVAIGTNVLIRDCEGNIVSGLRQVNGVYGHGTQSPEEVHFGLPLGENETYIIEVRYPNFDHPTDGITRLIATVVAQPSTIAGTNHYDMSTTDAEIVENVNAPIANDDFQTVAFGNTVSVQINLFDNDSEPDGEDFFIDSIVQPAIGSVVIDDADAGLVTYTYSAGIPFPGTTFDYTITDSTVSICPALGKSDTATVTIFEPCADAAGLDSDGDGLNDICDLDDDNDGILDTDEAGFAVLWVTSGTPGVEEQNVIDKLTSFGYTVTVVDQNTGGDADNYDVTFIYEDVTSGTALANVANLVTTEKGVITNETFLHDNVLGANVGATENSDIVTITDNTHPITYGLSIGDYDTGDASMRATGLTTGTVLGLHPSGQVSMAVWEVGDVLDTANAAPANAPGRRTIVPFSNSNGVYNTNGEELMLKAIVWTAGRDTDLDGIDDNLDVDSDNDGCTDAIEGAYSFTTFDVDGSGRLNGGVDADGIPLISGSPQNTQTDVTDSSDSTSCLDNDLDGIPDETDLDDDNDGILDTDECGDVSGGGYVQNASNISFFNNVANAQNDPGTSFADNGTTWPGGSSVILLRFPESVTVGTSISVFLSADPAVGSSDMQVQRSNAAGNDLGFLAGANGTTSGAIREVTFTVSGGPIEYMRVIAYNQGARVYGASYGGGVIDCTTVDTDGDTVPNYLDLDADNDGIYDVVEAGHDISSHTNGRLIGNIGTDGIPDSVQASGQENSGSTDYTLEDSDTDGDYDFIESDSDGDGCTDVLEAGYTESGTNAGELQGTGYHTTTGLVTGNSNGYTAPVDANSSTVYDYREAGSSTSITAQPLDQSVADGSSATFNVSTIGSSPGYQWQVSTNDGISFSDISGATSATYSVSSATSTEDGNFYRVVITDPGFVCAPLISNSAILTIASDFDNDGVVDTDDLDDDNDGILDTVEANNCNTGDPTVDVTIFSEDFGAANGNRVITPYTNYDFEDGTGSAGANADLQDGEYTIFENISATASWAPSIWQTQGDHTSGSDRMMIVNANNTAGLEFYRRQLVKVTEDVPLSISFWVMNLDTDISSNNGRTAPDITALIQQGGTTVYSFTTGAVSRELDGSPNAWKNYTGSFTPVTNAALEIVLINNAPGGSGNDLALDDIAITQSFCDTDGDGTPNSLQADSDGDGCNDSDEAYASPDADVDNNGMYGSSVPTVNSDGTVTTASYQIPADGDTNGNYDFLEVGTAANITVQPSNTSVCPSCVATFTVTGTNADAFQWQLLIGGSWTDLTNSAIYSGVNTATMIITNVSSANDNDQYRVIVSNSAYVCQEQISTAATLSVRVTTVITNRRITHRVKKN